jgi:LemA protein
MRLTRFAHRYAFAVLVPVVLSTAGCGYNQIQTLDERAEQTKHDIQNQLQRRADLIPNLVNTVKGYAAQEVTVFTNVANARAKLAGAIQTGDPQQMAAANDQLTGALGRLLVITEAYPQLKSDQNFLRLQDELTGTENRIAVARNDYNQAVNQYNAYIRTFPQAITARVTGAKSRTYFEASAGAQEAPTVDFTPTPAPTPAAPSAAPSTPAPAQGSPAQRP